MEIELESSACDRKLLIATPETMASVRRGYMHPMKNLPHLEI